MLARVAWTPRMPPLKPRPAAARPRDRMAHRKDARREPGALEAGRLSKANYTPEPCTLQQSVRSARETADGYPGVVARLSATRRVIRCRDSLQWIIQNRVSQGHATTRWRGAAYCRTKSALLRLCGRSSAPVDGIAWHILNALPEYFDAESTPAAILPPSRAVLTPPTTPAPIPAAGLQFVPLTGANIAGIIRHHNTKKETRHALPR